MNKETTKTSSSGDGFNITVPPTSESLGLIIIVSIMFGVGLGCVLCEILHLL